MSIHPKKSLGQHFLRDPNTIRKIVDALGAPPEAPVIEVGPGTGAMTEMLVARYPHLLAIEVDQRAVEHLRNTIPQLDVVHQDVLEIDWEELRIRFGEPLWVIGNLPYNITSPILFDLLDARHHLRKAVVMMQKEVAQRLVAAPSTKAYGIMSVQTQLWSSPRLLFTVGRNVFFPRPEVESAVVELDFTSSAPEIDPELLRGVVRGAFNQRRKTLRNSLSKLAAQRNAVVPEQYASLRAEELTPEDFVQLALSMAG